MFREIFNLSSIPILFEMDLIEKNVTSGKILIKHDTSVSTYMTVSNILRYVVFNSHSLVT